LGVPISVGIAVHRVFSVTVLAVGFLTVHFYELEFNFGHGGILRGNAYHNICLVCVTDKETAAQNEREAEDDFGFHGFSVGRSVAVGVFVEARRHNNPIAFVVYADFNLSPASLIVSIAGDDILVAPFHSTVLNMNVSAIADDGRPAGI
jgi:hypothetical protein